MNNKNNIKLNLPVIILKGIVLLPESELKLEFEDEISKNIIDEAEMFHDNKLLVITSCSIEENIFVNDLPSIGTIAKIVRKLPLPNGKVRIILKGTRRARVIEYLTPARDIIESIVSVINKEKIEPEIKNGIIRKLIMELDSYIESVPTMSNGLLSTINNLDDLDKITDIITNNLSLEINRVFQYLNEPNSIKRVEMLLEDMYKEKQLSNIEKNIDKKVKKELEEDQKNFYLKEKINLLKRELGEISSRDEEIELLREKTINLNANENIKNKILHEIDKYENMPSISPEISMVRNYIDQMLNLPWNNKTKDKEDLTLISQDLDKSHFGLEKIKTRIIEYLAVRKESSIINAPIICLVGPPGVGKTTFASSIAESIGRNFVKISLGGVDDEAIIKGHVRTYLGAASGKIIDGISRAKSSNPVFLIDEIDKMSNKYKGDPTSALLEVLDSTQNKYFKDNFIEEEYDLSEVLFITTANDIMSIPETLKDRLEIINIDGYTELEKIEISKKYLIPNICKIHGIKNIKISDDQLLYIIRFYTKESGLRELERLLSKIVRKIVAEKVINNKKISLTIKNVKEYLGEKIYEENTITEEIGQSLSLAYTNYGGDIVPIEVNNFSGTGNIILTGSMGDVMLDSAKIALSYVKANSSMFCIDENIFKDDIHINVPNISIKKDGPSAGVAITTAIISALSNLKISNKIAMTGEITLRGNILKVGGIKEKIMGAYLNNIEIVFIPYQNLNDIKDVPNEIKEKIKFIAVKNYKQIYEYLKEDVDE